MAPEVVARLSNLPTCMSEAHIRELVEPFVRLRRVAMPTPTLWHNCPTGRAEVVGDTEEETKLVYVHLHGTVIDGNRINVTFAKISEVEEGANNYSKSDVRAPGPVERRQRGRRSRSVSIERGRRGRGSRMERRRRKSSERRQVKKGDRRRSPLISPSRRHRRYSQSTSRHSSSSLSSRRRRRRRRSSSSSRSNYSRSRSRSPSWGD